MNVSKILEDKGNSVVTISADAEVANAIDLLNHHNVGALIALDAKDRVVGILSERDIVRRLRTGAAATLLSQPVSSIMTPKPVSCTRDDSVDDVMQMMTGRHFRHMPVIENDTLVGVISIGDVVKTKIEVTEGEAAALREYIAS